MKILIILVIAVGIAALLQLGRVYDLTAKLRKTREEEISFADNKMNAMLWLVFMVLFYAGVIYLFIEYGDYLPVSASEHCVGVDTLMSFNMIIITIVFFAVNTLLFYFSAKYYYKKDRKAKFFPHDNRLELVWTVVPSLVLAIVIIYGLQTWNAMTGEVEDGALRVEIYSKQFDWTARYAGTDSEFGLSSYNLITPTNPLGIVTDDGIEEVTAEIEGQVDKLKMELAYERGLLAAEKEELEHQLHEADHHGHDHGDHEHAEGDDHHGNDAWKDVNMNRIAEIEEMMESDKATVLTEAAIEAKREKIYRLELQLQRILGLDNNTIGDVMEWEAGLDDQVVRELHLPVGQEVEFIFRSRDVIHSAYMPHFRAQMNCVPGVPTRFKMTPTITTDSMRMITDNEEFDYLLLCNKVCGAAHFNMQMKVVVQSEEQYKTWLEQQKTFYVDESKENNESEDVSPADDNVAEPADAGDQTATID